jgi:hypothetical protein
MAIDTRNKRASAICPGLVFLRPLPLADGSIGVGDRKHVAGSYRGLGTDLPAVPPVRIRTINSGVNWIYIGLPQSFLRRPDVV